MKKLIPFLVSSILVVGAVGCQDASKNASETPSTTNEASQPAKEASAKTKTTAKSPILSKLEEKIPGSKLVVAEKDGVVTVTGTVPTEADIKKIEPLVKEQKGVKTVKVEAKAASTKAK
ncbi:BON domain-containing protein [Tolypothrix sp. FACHB-123]|uniref:BON domain-containing protein n=1 Tax=Tolypothrix sp. FACHB-123 TaxID=2692868 RepID=UPI0016841D08|nr:BON domain-containing protein [Tolypothrix sp. FACHB-123]MBD2359131.1 BON domain-containing protein [Tolypothrix sp. FACHB-123]